MATNPLWSTVAKKFLLALTGLSLFVFVGVHLAGNLLLFVGPDAFNFYSHTLMGLGGLLYVAEAILVAFFLIHFVTGAAVAWGNWRARPGRYRASGQKGGPSRMTVASRTMIWTGLILLVFTVIHVATFKYGPGEAEGYVTLLDGEPVRDLYRLVAETFNSEVYVIWYVAAMIFLGFHLSHGFWSAVQSLGIHDPRWTPILYGFGVVAAVLLGVGFLVIPVWFYFGGSAS